MLLRFLVESGQGPFDEPPAKGVTFAGLARISRGDAAW
jgi:hypothetical protein